MMRKKRTAAYFLVLLLAILFSALAVSGYHIIMTLPELFEPSEIPSATNAVGAVFEPSVPRHAERKVLVGTDSVLNILYTYDGHSVYYTRSPDGEASNGDFTVVINGFAAEARIARDGGLELQWSDGEWRHTLSGDIGIAELCVLAQGIYHE